MNTDGRLKSRCLRCRNRYTAGWGCTNLWCRNYAIEADPDEDAYVHREAMRKLYAAERERRA